MPSETYAGPPPSYVEATGANREDSDDIRRHSTSSAAFNPVHTRSTPAQQIFPPAFSVYVDSPRHYVLGEKRVKPLYAISTYSTLSATPDLMIHRGAWIDTPVMAAIQYEPLSRSASITLPPRPGSRLAAAHERLDAVGAFTRVMSFSIETSLSSGAREHFEWRHSSGIEVEALGGRHSGWKLVRVSPPPVYRLGRKHNNALGGHSSDGREVVAVWSGPIMFMNKVLRFRFLGSGADGCLGERWAIMAVASALAIWNRDRRSRNNLAAAASAGF
ncbi:hypothetical protein GGR50DRAFT_375799 [Xylaria sp. CBS 124048]|nr:hypothetical protein GGR50DRAFT_375799 [Xylaria sp. CBS 124048]